MRRGQAFSQVRIERLRFLAIVALQFLQIGQHGRIGASVFIEHQFDRPDMGVFTSQLFRVLLAASPEQ